MSHDDECDVLCDVLTLTSTAPMKLNADDGEWNRNKTSHSGICNCCMYVQWLSRLCLVGAPGKRGNGFFGAVRPTRVTFPP